MNKEPSVPSAPSAGEGPPGFSGLSRWFPFGMITHVCMLLTFLFWFVMNLNFRILPT